VRVELHLAPQIMNPRDPDTGRARKWILGPWIFPVLGVLAKFKFLRGTPFDPFGWTAHRRRERELIAEYERTLAELIEGLSPETHALAVEIASVPEQIRGFDLVKERHLHDAKAKEALQLAAFRQRVARAG
jgi:indolepyruvate ferredoxin oxidoreductase